MRNSINQKYFESFANELAGKFRRINHLTTNARVAIGNYHEEILKVAIKNFLSDRYTVKTGYIYFDDQKKHVEACQSMGIKSFLFTDEKDFQKKSKELDI